MLTFSAACVIPANKAFLILGCQSHVWGILVEFYKQVTACPETSASLELLETM